MVLGLPRRPKGEVDWMDIIRDSFRFLLGDPHIHCYFGG
jgi:hypothetical protein